MKGILRYRILALGAALILTVEIADAAVMCADKNGKVVVARNNVCPKKTTMVTGGDIFGFNPQAGPQGAQGATGPQGPAGSNGADEETAYGDGSDGALVISSNTVFNKPLGQFTNVTINSGVVLTVRSGTTIRCNNNFVNNGTINVTAGAAGGDVTSAQAGNPTALTVKSFSPPQPGVASSAAQNGEFGPNTVHLSGGIGGYANGDPYSLINIGPYGGGGGGAGSNTGGWGGGSFRVLCKTMVSNSNTGVINAVGEDASNGGGGGGGGVVILASSTLINQAGTINVNGGEGGAGVTSAGPGAGGGGGIVHLISPIVSSTGTINVDKGPYSSGGVSTTNTYRSAGAGGGGSGGYGGTGFSIQSNNSIGSWQLAADGVSITTLTDPANLLR